MLKTFGLQIKEVYMYIQLVITHIVMIILLFCKFPHCCIVSMIHRSSREVWALSSQSTMVWTEWAAPWRTRVQNPTDQKSTRNSVPWRPSGIPSVPSQWTGKGMFNYQLKPCCSKWYVIYQLLDVLVLLVDITLTFALADRGSWRRPCCLRVSSQRPCRPCWTGWLRWSPPWGKTSPCMGTSSQSTTSWKSTRSVT